jgi:hypothetical protein
MSGVCLTETGNLGRESKKVRSETGVEAVSQVPELGFLYLRRLNFSRGLF